MTVKNEQRLPSDWSEKFKVEKNGKKTKYYMNVRTGQKFFSEEDLLRYVQMKRTQLEEPHPSNGHGERHSGEASLKIVANENNHESTCAKQQSAKWSTKYVAKENNQESSLGKEHLEKSSPKPIVEENAHDKSCGKTHSENGSTKSVAEESNRPEWLPDGWAVEVKTRKTGSAKGRQYKVYIEPLTGGKFFSKPEVLRHLESVENRSSECERKTTHTEISKYEDPLKVSTITEGEATFETSKNEDAQKFSTRTKRKTTETVVVEKSTVDDLPPGWIKETKFGKTARGVRKDSFYTDPVSGYVFNSKKDVFRYLETGKISKYAVKPKEIRTHETELVTEEASPSPDAERQKMEQTATRRRLFPVKESSKTGLAGAPSELSRQRVATMVSDKGAETKDICGTDLPKFRGSRRNQVKIVFADDGLVSTPVIDSIQEQRLLESGNGKTRDMDKSVEKENLNFPLRSSKRLAGFEPELVSNCVSIPKNITKTCDSKTIQPASLIASGEPSSKFKSSGSLAISGGQLQKFKSAKTNNDKSEQHLPLSFGDSYLDPCLESAFKALTGELLVSSNPDKGPGAADILLEKSMPTTEWESGSSRKPQINSKQSKNRRELNMPRRSSKRLAGAEPELGGSGEPLELASKNVTTEPCKDKGIPPAGLTSRGLVNEVSPQLKTGIVLGLPNRASLVLGIAKHVSSQVNIPSGGKPSNEIKSSEFLAMTGGKSAEANDEKSEPHGHPFKAMVDEKLVDSLPDNEPVAILAAIIQPEKKLQDTKVEKSSNKRPRINSKKSKSKQELNFPRRASKRLAGIESELITNSVSSELVCEDVTTESCKREDPTCEETDPHGPVEAGNKIIVWQTDFTDKGSPSLKKSSEKSSKPLEAPTVPEEPSQELETEKPEEQPQRLQNDGLEEQPQTLENERIDNENPGSQILRSFENSWSDPCLEFAYRTLTGAIQVDENLAIQDYFQHQLDPSNSQSQSQSHEDNSSALPVFGATATSTSQADFPHQLDAPERQSAPPPRQQLYGTSFPPEAHPQPQLPASLFPPLDPSQQQLPASPFPPQENASTPSFGSIDLNSLF